MRRREFIKVVAGTTAAWPLMADAQQLSRKIPRIGEVGGVAEAVGARSNRRD